MQIQEYLWKESDGKTTGEKNLARASYQRYTERIQKAKPSPMSGMRFFLSDLPASTVEAYKRLIRLAGGTIVSNVKEATVILCQDVSKGPQIPNVPCKAPLYLSEVILG